MMDDGITTPRRRRRHSAEFKAQVIQACKQPGVSIAATALRYQLNANQVFGLLVIGKQAVCQLDEFRIGLGSLFAFYGGHFFLYAGSVLPNDHLHKIFYILNALAKCNQKSIRREPPILNRYGSSLCDQ